MCVPFDRRPLLAIKRKLCSLHSSTVAREVGDFRRQPLLFFVNLPFINTTKYFVLSDSPKLFTREEGNNSSATRNTPVVSKNNMEAGDFKRGTRLRAER